MPPRFLPCKASATAFGFLAATDDARRRGRLGYADPAPGFCSVARLTPSMRRTRAETRPDSSETLLTSSGPNTVVRVLFNVPRRIDLPANTAHQLLGPSELPDRHVVGSELTPIVLDVRTEQVLLREPSALPAKEQAAHSRACSFPMLHAENRALDPSRIRQEHRRIGGVAQHDHEDSRHPELARCLPEMPGAALI